MALLLEVDDAELRGDTDRALALMMGADGRGGGWWRPSRIERLLQIRLFEPWLPRWATSRWILELALQDLGPQARRPKKDALETAIEVRGGVMALPGSHRLDARAKVIDGDWVYRQVYLYECEGLSAFVRRRATGDLLAGADSINDWARAAMGAYQLVGQAPTVTTWRDVATGETLEMANLGCGALMVPGEHAIGRVVPIEAGVMFETAPLVVPEAVAAKVASDPCCWLDALRQERDAGRGVPTAGGAWGFLCDLPRVVYLVAALPDGVLDCLPEGPLDQRRRQAMADGLITMARSAIRATDEGSLAVDELNPWPCLAGAVMDPSVYVALAQSVSRLDRSVLGQLAERLPAPAAGVVQGLLAAGEAAA